MGSLVLDLQQEVLKSDCDVLSALRKAHLIAAKLQLQDFDVWIQHELNGYTGCTIGEIPDYRKVRGVLKAFNPYNGWIPAQCSDDELENRICAPKMSESIGELKELYQQSKNGVFLYQFNAELMEAIASMFNTPIPMQFALHISAHYLKSIIEKVKNCLLEWTIRLETKGILGENMQFSREETIMAKEIPQQVINYYGTVVNGAVSQSQITTGDHNSIAFNYEQASNLMKKIRTSIEQEQLSDEDRESAMELISEAETKIVAQKKPGLVRATLTGLRDFLISVGANVTAALIVQCL